MARRLVKRVGWSAFAKHHQLRRDLLIIIAVSKSGLTSPDADTPVRQYADPPIRRPASPPPSKIVLEGSRLITSRSLSSRRGLLLLQPLLLGSSAARWFRANGED